MHLRKYSNWFAITSSTSITRYSRRGLLRPGRPQQSLHGWIYGVPQREVPGHALVLMFILLLSWILTAQADNSAIYPGGDATYRGTLNKFAYSHPSANLTAEQKLDFTLGKAMFKRLWVSAPSSTQAADGLGPLFNARSCLQCHKGNGRGRPQKADGKTDVSLLLRFTDPIYGKQLQTFAVRGVAAEGQVDIAYSPIEVQLADGETVTLRKPHYKISSLAYGDMATTALSPRMAPQMIGLGLLEAISQQDLAKLADPNDVNGDGISGRLGQGRFGWKASMPSLNEQVQNAFATDIGISVPLFKAAAGDCTEQQTACQQAPHGNSPQYENLEAHSQVVEWTNHYVRNLAVPKRRNWNDPQVQQGEKLFYQSGCAGCHQPQFVTKADVLDFAQAGQKIWPYTDLLLHDMGDGLADGYVEGQTSGREWRTPPLWGIGLSNVVNGNAYYLHDGRARTVLEAILWHAGEAQTARDKVVGMGRAQRQKLIRFIESL
jgi:CxxC motif-containing protein (DUF1111 family)